MNEKFYSIDKINGLQTPALRDVLLFYLNLFRHDLVPDFLATLSNIGPSRHHALINDDAQRIVVHSHSMIMFTHDLGGCVKIRDELRHRIAFIQLNGAVPSLA